MMSILPESNFAYGVAEVKCSGSYSESLENTTHSWNADTITIFQSGDLCSLHTYPLTQLFLCEVLL